MRRRAVLAMAGTTAIGSTAGCTSALGIGECTPGDDRIAEIDMDLSGYTEADRVTDERYHVRGTVVRQSYSTRVVIDDGTGFASLSVGDTQYVFDDEEIDVGECLEGSGPLSIPETGEHEIPHVALDPDTIDGGSSEKDAGPVPEEPSQSISSDYSGLDDELTLTVTGDPEIRSDRLLVRWRELDSGTPWTQAVRTWWHELTDVDPGETIPDGSQCVRSIGNFDYSALWVSDERNWCEQLDQLETSDGWWSDPTERE
ncbi:hypothetical protein [Halovivax cerinus]|uniref:Uncharacterized protein n=1 Tax=Halovivax cerinus TaxID=1487865 RepID=A0ABD5NM16_9EURY|nr:hypothetical protein [Halovivax cerinus]